MKPKSKVLERPGYREPRTAAEQRFWDCHHPDLKKWALKSRLTIEEAAALAMDLDSSCLEYMSDDNRTHERFQATKAWFLRNESMFRGRINLEKLWILGSDNGEDNLPLNSRISHVVDLEQVGFLAVEQKIARLERQIETLKKDKIELQEKIATLVPATSKKKRATDLIHYENTSSKLIVSLIVASFDDENECVRQLAKIKEGRRSVGIASHVTSAVQKRGWKIDDDSVLKRIRSALVDWDPKDDLADI